MVSSNSTRKHLVSGGGRARAAQAVDGRKKVRLKEHPILDFPAGREVVFTFDGKELRGIEGEPIAAALHASGVRVLRHSPVSGRARGFFCAIGNCSSCLMTVDGMPNVRVCTEPLKEGMVVETQKGHGHLPID